jgi:putative ubiquitin-RnfH superfamily antitoxin RatB of RatAB toxin-antitoxin module
MPSLERIKVTLVRAEPARVIWRQYSLAQGSTVDDVLTLAAADADFAPLDMAHTAVGVFGRVVQRNQRLQEGDRVELYRPLAEDPKTARRRRARAGRQG